MSGEACTNFLQHCNTNNLICLLRLLGRDISTITRISVLFPRNKIFSPETGQLVPIRNTNYLDKLNNKVRLSAQCIYKLSSRKTDVQLNNLMQLSVHIMASSKATINTEIWCLLSILDPLKVCLPAFILTTLQAR